jgi:hypothetical protein
MSETCRVCGEPIPEEYDKWDSNAPVYGPERGEVRHLDCEDAFEEIYCEL